MIQLNFNLVDQRIIENNLIKECAKQRIGIFAKTPLCFGLLTGNYQKKTDFPIYDHRNRWSKEQIKIWAEACNLFSSQVSTEKTQTNAQIALRFCLSFSQISSVVTGILTPEHVRENAKSSLMGPFSSTIKNDFIKIYQNHRFYISS